MVILFLKFCFIDNRTLCRPVLSVIILMISKSDSHFSRGRPILLITRMITDRIGLHSVPLPLYIHQFVSKKYIGQILFNYEIMIMTTMITVITKQNISAHAFYQELCIYQFNQSF